MPSRKKSEKHIEEKVIEGAGKVLEFFQPGDQSDHDPMDLVGDQSNKNRKPPFDLI